MRLFHLTPWLASLCFAWNIASAQPAGDASQFQSGYSRVSLLALTPQGVAPGVPLWAGLRIEHAPGWHTYWKNPGDSGLPTQLRWELPAGVTAGEVQWPTPSKFPLGDLANYGYGDTVLLPVPLTVTQRLDGQKLRLKVHASWLSCRKECIPEEARLQLQIPARPPDTTQQALFEQAWQQAPVARPLPGSQLRVQDQQLEVRLKGLPPTWRGQTLEFFPELAGVIEPGAAWQQAWEGATWTARLPLSAYRSASPTSMALVVAPAQTPPVAGVASTLKVDGDWPALETPTPTEATSPTEMPAPLAPPRPSTPNTAWAVWLALAGAFLGGLLLNLMPCVFPVLALKVMAFTQHKQDTAAHHRDGLAYTAGVLLSFVALGAVLLLLRASGEQLGWGFQLQNPWVVAGLCALFTALGLNLAGLFEIRFMLPSRWLTWRARHAGTDAFLTGVLATAVASPCTAPFMGASLGLAIGLPDLQALGVFAALGLGMASPYLVASWVPAVTRYWPRPGAWMQEFRQLMAFPMLGTVVWLLWVLGQQSGTQGMAALLLLLLAMAWWLWTLGRHGRGRSWWLALATAVLVWLGWSIGPEVGQSAPPPSSAAVSTGWAPWSADRQRELQDQGRPVLVDFTAAWCITCQYNKHNALANEQVLQLAAEKKVALLRADWTLRAPDVTEALKQLQRNGVPTYALYAPGRPPLVLTEVLSTDELLQALHGI